jgi:hypothetical protein
MREKIVCSHEVHFMGGASAGKPVFVRANIYVNNMFLYITTLGSQQNDWSHRSMPSGSVSNTRHAQGCTNPGRQADQATGVRTTAPNISEPHL